MSAREDQAVRYWLTEKGETAAAQLDLPRCQAIVGCTTPATGQTLSYAQLGYVPACPMHGGGRG